MVIVDDLKALTRPQRAAFFASLLGWTLDAFDFFLLVFLLKAIATDFHSKVSDVSEALFLTLALRPLGALVFGWLADRFGRRPVMMIDVGLYSVLAFASSFAPDLSMLLILRAGFGFAMGGEWGIGASLTMESIPAKSRGLISGVLQEGYALGYLLAAGAYWLLGDHLDWRWFLRLSIIPALLIIYIRLQVPESPAWEAHRDHPDAKKGLGFGWLVKRWPLALYAMVMMTAFNLFSHGAQDLYPTFLKVQRHFTADQVGPLTIVANLGAIIGGVLFGVLSERIGRRRAIVLAALFALPAIPLWAYSATPLLLGVGAFLIQIAVQGAWGVVPAHLNELSPDEARGVFPGLVYQLGNLAASRVGVWQTQYAEANNNDYASALAYLIGGVALLIAVIVFFGPEARGKVFGRPAT